MKTVFSPMIALLLAAGFARAEPVVLFLILDNDQLIEGDIRREKDRYIIKRGQGEASIPASRVTDTATTRAEVHQIMRGRCNLRDTDDRLRLIRWLMGSNLRSEALAEAEELATFRPDDREVVQLRDGLRALAKAPVARKKTPPTRVLEQPVEVAPARYNPDSFPLFQAKVQPVLVNLCIRCHAEGQGHGYVLSRVADGGDRRATLVNLAASATFLDARDVDESALLRKALTAHGGAMAPTFRDQQNPAFQNLRAWAQLAVAGIEPSAPPSPVADLEPKLAPRPTPASPIVFGETSQSQAAPEPRTEPKDPFDPAIFNGTIQPKR
jgi:hypothetical protein